jgi:CHASE3 domain sensor protein
MEKSNKLIFGIVFLLCLVIIIIGIVKINSLNKEVKTQEDKNTEIKVDLSRMKNNYQQGINSIIREYLLNNDNLEINDFVKREENTKQTIDKVMDLTLTKEFKDFHLKLIIVLNSIQEEYKTIQTEETVETQDEINLSLEKLDKLFVDYPLLNN